MSIIAKIPSYSAHYSMCSPQMIPSIPRKRNFNYLLAENSSLHREEPKAKKAKVSELLDHPSQRNDRPRKTVTFSDDIREIRFQNRDTPRSLLHDGIDDDVEDDIEDGNEHSNGYYLSRITLHDITLTPQQRALTRTLSLCDIEFDDQFGDELDSQLTGMHLGEVSS